MIEQKNRMFPHRLNDICVSNSKVLHSPAGWYIGREAVDEDGRTFPLMRESGYYPNPYIAQAELDEGIWGG